MIKNVKLYLESEIGISIYDSIGIILFAFVFVFALTYAFGISKKHIDEIKNFPLNDQNDLDYGKKK
jgi:cbb3-type cytochrome oxidase subunit 3